MGFLDVSQPMGYGGLRAATRELRQRCRSLQGFTLGKSVLGRNIPAYVVGTGRPYALYCGAHHSLEYITAMLLVEFAHDLCSHAETGLPLAGFAVRGLLRERSAVIVPMLNPDGVELFLHGADTAGPLSQNLLLITSDFSDWQANAHGVDLNHNYNAGFQILQRMERERGIDGPGPRRYGGSCPESEPETRALCNLCRRLPFARTFALHSQGEEIYWNYGPRTPRKSFTIARELAACSGYRMAQPEAIASHGGFKDWFIETFERPGFTIEVGFGRNPLPLSDFPMIYEKLLPMLLLGLTL